MKKYLITVNGKQYEVDCEEIKDGAAPQQVSETYTAKNVKTQEPAAPKVEKKEEAPAPKASPAGKEGAVKVVCPMPGAIVKVNVNVGDTVKKGQPIVILEAMKMENEIPAPEDGTVSSINVTKGSSVNAGDVLATLN